MRYSNRSGHSSSRPFVQRLLSSPITLILACILVVILVRASWNIHVRAAQSATKLKEAQDELAKLTARKDDLSAKVTRLSSPDGVEAEIRTKYRAVKGGESVAVLIDDPNNAAATALASTTPKRGWWRVILSWFGL